MRLLHKKSGKKRWIAWALVCCLAILAVPASAASSKISEAQKKKDAAQKELNAINKQISSLESQRAAIVSEIDSLDSELEELVLNLEMLEYDLEKKIEDLNQAQLDYEAAVERENNQYEAMKLRIQYIYEEGSIDYLSLFLESGSMADFLTKSDYAQEIHAQDKNMLEAYQEAKEEVERLREQLEEEKAELEILQAEYKEEKSQVEQKLAEKQSQEADFSSKLASAQKKAKDYQKAITEQDAKIKKLQEEARKAEEARRAAERAASQDNSSSGSGGSSGGSAVTSIAALTGGGGNSSKGAQIASYAQQFVGNPYVYGGSSLTNGTDCSGFTMSVFAHFGISLPHSSAAQLGVGRGVSYSEAQPGDIVCYSGHVGIYVGGGRIVHASTPSTGIIVSSATTRTILGVRRCY